MITGIKERSFPVDGAVAIYSYWGGASATIVFETIEKAKICQDLIREIGRSEDLLPCKNHSPMSAEWIVSVAANHNGNIRARIFDLDPFLHHVANVLPRADSPLVVPHYVVVFSS